MRWFLHYSFVLNVFLSSLGAFYFELVNVTGKSERKKIVMRELAAIMVCAGAFNA